MTIAADFERDGFVVIRSAVPEEQALLWREWWNRWYSKHGATRELSYNKVAVDTIPPGLEEMPKHPALLDIVEQVFGPDIALYNYRFVVKDQHSRDAVFLHQDTPYHVGWPQKASMFVALSHCHPWAGGMVFLKGSHKFGYLGDAGQIDNTVCEQGHHLHEWGAPELQLGDAILMHSATWHESTAHLGNDRILADIIYQPASDPSGRELLRGQWRCTPQPWLHSPHLFVRSRISRIKDLEEQCRSK